MKYILDVCPFPFHLIENISKYQRYRSHIVQASIMDPTLILLIYLVLVILNLAVFTPVFLRWVVTGVLRILAFDEGLIFVAGILSWIGRHLFRALYYLLGFLVWLAWVFLINLCRDIWVIFTGTPIYQVLWLFGPWLFGFFYARLEDSVGMVADVLLSVDYREVWARIAGTRLFLCGVAGIILSLTWLWVDEQSFLQHAMRC